MLTKERYEEVKAIIADIRSGKKSHNQALYHCGTAHCIAGWLEVNELERRGLSTTWIQPDPENLGKVLWVANDGTFRPKSPVVSEKIDCMSDTWEWAGDYLGITETEDLFLFDLELTLDEIEANLENLAEKYGVK